MKDYFLLFTGVLCALFSNAQSTNIPLDQQMDSMFANLDLSSVSSDHLLDRGCKMMEIAAFDGSINADTLFDYGDWFRQYGTLVTSRLNSMSSAPLGLQPCGIQN